MDIAGFSCYGAAKMFAKARRSRPVLSIYVVYTVYNELYEASYYLLVCVRERGVVVKALRYKPAGPGSIPDGVIGIFQ